MYNWQGTVCSNLQGNQVSLCISQTGSALTFLGIKMRMFLSSQAGSPANRSWMEGKGRGKKAVTEGTWLKLSDGTVQKGKAGRAAYSISPSSYSKLSSLLKLLIASSTLSHQMTPILMSQSQFCTFLSFPTSHPFLFSSLVVLNSQHYSPQERTLMYEPQSLFNWFSVEQKHWFYF